MPHGVGHGFGRFHWSRGIGLSWLRRQWTRRHDDNAQGLLCDAPMTVFDLHLTAYAVAMPAPGRRVPGPPRLLQPAGEGRWLPPPGCAGLADGTGARDSRDAIDRRLETHAQRAATIGLTSRDDPPHPLHAPGQTLCNRHGGVHTIAAVAITHPEAPGYAALPTHAQAEAHLCEVVTTVLARPGGRPRRPRRLRFLRLGPLACHRGGVLMPPGRRDGIDRQGFESDRRKYRLEMGRQQRIEDGPPTVIIQGGTRESRLHQRDHPTRVESSADLREGLLPIQHREHQGCHPTTTREPRRRVRWDEMVNGGGDLQAP